MSVIPRLSTLLFSALLLSFALTDLSIASSDVDGTDPPEKTGVQSISATTWAGTDSEGHYYIFHFKSSGALHYKSPTGFWTRGTWKQDGAEVYMETNNKYSEYFGTIKGNHMQGTVRNIKGKKWRWSATKK